MAPLPIQVTSIINAAVGEHAMCSGIFRSFWWEESSNTNASKSGYSSEFDQVLQKSCVVGVGASSSHFRSSQGAVKKKASSFCVQSSADRKRVTPVPGSDVSSNKGSPIRTTANQAEFSYLEKARCCKNETPEAATDNEDAVSADWSQLKLQPSLTTTLKFLHRKSIGLVGFFSQSCAYFVMWEVLHWEDSDGSLASENTMDLQFQYRPYPCWG